MEILLSGSAVYLSRKHLLLTLQSNSPDTASPSRRTYASAGSFLTIQVIWWPSDRVVTGCALCGFTTSRPESIVSTKRVGPKTCYTAQLHALLLAFFHDDSNPRIGNSVLWTGDSVPALRPHPSCVDTSRIRFPGSSNCHGDVCFGARGLRGGSSRTVRSDEV